MVQSVYQIIINYYSRDSKQKHRLRVSIVEVHQSVARQLRCYHAA
jgi:hypothetical protein